MQWRALTIKTFSTAALIAAAVAGAAGALAQPASLAGTYDGGQMEMAAALELKADGRFRYALAYGALDEEAAGKWSMSGTSVLLTSDRVIAPRFVLVSSENSAAGVLQLSLDLPRGLSRQYFNAVITQANGETHRQQLGDDGLLLRFTKNEAPTSIRMLFPVFSVAGEPVKLDPGSGHLIRFRFEPNDLGKVDFQATPLRLVGGDLLLDRHGRTIRFRRAAR